MATKAKTNQDQNKDPDTTEDDAPKRDIVAETRAALADGAKPLPKGARINFGDPEPIRAARKGD